MSDTKEAVPEFPGDRLKATRGWGRLFDDAANGKVEVSIETRGGRLSGRVLALEQDVVVFEERTDRYRKNIAYVPLSQIIALRAYFI